MSQLVKKGIELGHDVSTMLVEHGSRHWGVNIEDFDASRYSRNMSRDAAMPQRPPSPRQRRGEEEQEEDREDGRRDEVISLADQPPCALALPGNCDCSLSRVKGRRS